MNVQYQLTVRTTTPIISTSDSVTHSSLQELLAEIEESLPKLVVNSDSIELTANNIYSNTSTTAANSSSTNQTLNSVVDNKLAGKTTINVSTVPGQPLEVVGL